MSASPYTHLDGCAIIATTEKAVLVRVPFDEEDGTRTHEQLWFPRSQLADEGAELKAGQDDVTVSCTKWIALQKGIDPEGD